MSASPPASPPADWPFQVVADTNVWVSAVLPAARQRAVASGFNHPQGYEIIQRAFYDEFDLLFSLATYLELIEKLEELQVPRPLIEEIAMRIHERAVHVEPSSSQSHCADPDDDKFIQVAVDGCATHLISGDRDVNALDRSRYLFRIVGQSTFLRELRERLRSHRKATK